MELLKKCDAVLNFLSYDVDYHSLSSIHSYLHNDNIKISPTELVQCITILSNDKHIHIERSFYKGKDSLGYDPDNESYHGSIRISESGGAFIAKTNYESEVRKQKLQEEILTSQLRTNENQRATNQHLIDNNIFLNKVFKATLVLSIVSLFVSLVMLWLAFQTNEREKNKYKVELLSSENKHKRFKIIKEIHLLKENNVRLKRFSDSLTLYRAKALQNK
jgi:hypothetical protein